MQNKYRVKNNPSYLRTPRSTRGCLRFLPTMPPPAIHKTLKKSTIGSNQIEGKQSGVKHTLYRQGWVPTQSVPRLRMPCPNGLWRSTLTQAFHAIKASQREKMLHKERGTHLFIFLCHDDQGFAYNSTTWYIQNIKKQRQMKVEKKLTNFLVFPHHQSPASGVVTRIGASDISIPPPRQEP